MWRSGSIKQHKPALHFRFFLQYVASCAASSTADWHCSSVVDSFAFLERWSDRLWPEQGAAAVRDQTHRSVLLTGQRSVSLHSTVRKRFRQRWLYCPACPTCPCPSATVSSCCSETSCDGISVGLQGFHVLLPACHLIARVSRRITFSLPSTSTCPFLSVLCLHTCVSRYLGIYRRCGLYWSYSEWESIRCESEEYKIRQMCECDCSPGHRSAFTKKTLVLPAFIWTIQRLL